MWKRRVYSKQFLAAQTLYHDQRRCATS
jgi:hypothetical protein